MKYMKPVLLTPISTTGISLSMYPEYNGASSYNVNDIVKVTYTTGTYNGKTPAELVWQREYKALISMGPQTAGQEPWYDPTRWLDLGPTNPYRMLDNKTTSVTRSVTGSAFTATVSFTETINRIVLLTLVNPTSNCILTLSNFAGTSTIATTSFVGTGKTKFHWANWTGAPTTGGRITVYFTGATGVQSGLGFLLAGQDVSIGDATYPVQAGILDFSRKEFDQYGDLTLVQRSYADKLSCAMLVKSTLNTTIKDTLASLRATPCIWDANMDTNASPDETLRLYGFLRSFNVDIQGYNLVYCNMEVEGLAT